MVDLPFFAASFPAAEHEAAGSGLLAGGEEWLPAGEQVGVGFVVVEDGGDGGVLGHVEVVVEGGGVGGDLRMGVLDGL